jgi:hypothetical protein
MADLPTETMDPEQKKISNNTASAAVLINKQNVPLASSR